MLTLLRPADRQVSPNSAGRIGCRPPFAKNGVKGTGVGNQMMISDRMPGTYQRFQISRQGKGVPRLHGITGNKGKMWLFFGPID